MAGDWFGLAQMPVAAEYAAPVASLDAVARHLRERFGARSVSFLFVKVGSGGHRRAQASFCLSPVSPTGYAQAGLI